MNFDEKLKPSENLLRQITRYSKLSLRISFKLKIIFKVPTKTVRVFIVAFNDDERNKTPKIEILLKNDKKKFNVSTKTGVKLMFLV